MDIPFAIIPKLVSTAFLEKLGVAVGFTHLNLHIDIRNLQQSVGCRGSVLTF
jgi:hypothetical protein